MTIVLSSFNSFSFSSISNWVFWFFRFSTLQSRSGRRLVCAAFSAAGSSGANNDVNPYEVIIFLRFYLSSERDFWEHPLINKYGCGSIKSCGLFVGSWGKRSWGVWYDQGSLRKKAQGCREERWWSCCSWSMTNYDLFWNKVFVFFYKPSFVAEGWYLLLFTFFYL